MGRLRHDERERDLFRLLPLIFLGGAIFGAAECVYHRMGTPPLGPLRSDGASYPAFLAVISVAFLALPSLAALILRQGLAGRIRLLWFLALFPTLWVYLDHLARFSHWPLLSYQNPQLFVVQTGVLALLLSVLLSWGLVKISRKWMGRRLSMPARTWWFLPVVILSLWLFALPVPSRDLSTVTPEEDAPCVLLLSIDTLRADDASSLVAPYLQQLAQRGVSVEAWAPSPWTRPSFASLFSGMAPTGHGAGKYSAVDSNLSWWPELLAERGWDTKAIVTNPHLERGLGFGRGFADFDHSSHLERLEPAAQMIWVRWAHRLLQERLDRGDRIIARAVRWLRGTRRDPWLLWVHLIDPHVPYHPRGPQGETEDTSDGRWLDPLRPFLEDGVIGDVPRLRLRLDEMDDSARAALREMYRREILFFDRHLADLFDAAEKAAGGRELFWAVTSDHGEEFFDHGGFEHGHSLYGELLRVPMILGGPGLSPGTRSRGMKLQDLGPTLLSLMEEAPMLPHGRAMDELDDRLRPYVVGEDFSPQLWSADQADSCAGVNMVAENLLYGSRRTRLIEADGASWLRDDETLSFHALDCCGPEAELPRELAADALPGRAKELLDAMDRWRAAASLQTSVLVDDPALQQRLRSLGYIE